MLLVNCSGKVYKADISNVEFLRDQIGSDFDDLIRKMNERRNELLNELDEKVNELLLVFRRVITDTNTFHLSQTLGDLSSTVTQEDSTTSFNSISIMYHLVFSIRPQSSSFNSSFLLSFIFLIKSSKSDPI